LAIHQHRHAFDLILIDGRFRVACTAAAIQHILKYASKTSHCYLFIHDFWNRPVYHVVLPFLEKIDRVDSAGLFKVRSDLDQEKLALLWEQYSRQPA
ncbi:hypothetical protein ACT3R4_16275, partial [Halomonas sp. AOP7-E1-9]